MRIIILLILFKFSTFSLAQDERFYRKLFTGEVEKNRHVKKHYKFIVDSPAYILDLNRDKIDEKIILSKRDGVDFLVIKNSSGKVVFSSPLETIGNESKVTKIWLKTIDSQTDVLIIQFFEGVVQASQFEATARLYFLTIENRDLNTFSIFKGPHFWHELEKLNDQYINRNFSINVKDYNQDGRNEISISYNKIARIYFYIKEGRWKRL